MKEECVRSLNHFSNWEKLNEKLDKVSFFALDSFVVDNQCHEKLNHCNIGPNTRDICALFKAMLITSHSS